MAQKAIYEVIGARELRLSLRKAGDDLKDLKEANLAAAKIAAEKAEADAPERSGRLKANIRAGASKTAGVVRDGNNSKIRYAGPIHWGWAARGIKANPFISNAAKETEPEWTRVYEARVDLLISKVKGAPSA